MNCWVCGISLTLPLGGKISFRAECDKCGTALHCCKNCKFYSPGRSNDCLIPGTEFIPDRSKNNHCEEFSILGKPPTQKDKEGTKSFEDLFK